MFQILAFFWFVRTAKIILFWVYLWQLKEYHLGRFKAHFSTAKGKQLISNKFLILKIILLLGFLFSSVFIGFGFRLFNFALLLPLILLFLYLIETAKIFKDFFKKKLKKPVLTKKNRNNSVFLFYDFCFHPCFFMELYPTK